MGRVSSLPLVCWLDSRAILLGCRRLLIGGSLVSFRLTLDEVVCVGVHQGQLERERLAVVPLDEALLGDLDDGAQLLVHLHDFRLFCFLCLPDGPQVLLIISLSIFCLLLWLLLHSSTP